MHRIASVLPLLTAALIFVLVSATSATARTWYIKPDGTGDAPTIQAGVDSAASWDSVLVAAGTYHDCTHMDASGTLNCVKVAGKLVWLHGESGAEATIIDAQGAGRVILADDVQFFLDGFTITGGESPTGGGIRLDDAYGGEISHSIIAGNAATAEGGGIFVDLNPSGYPLVVTDCRLMDNVATNGAAIEIDWGIVQVEHTIVMGNTTVSGGGGAIHSTFTYYPLDISDSLIADNACPGISVTQGLSRAEDLNVTGVTLAGNENPQVVVTDWTPRFERTICIGTVLCINTDYPGSFLHCDFSHPPGSICGNWVTPNLNADPLFCDPDNGDYSLAANSPCLPENNDWGVLVGALGEGCGPISRLHETWTRIKARYR
jgi:hypothetical protein